MKHRLFCLERSLKSTILKKKVEKNNAWSTLENK